MRQLAPLGVLPAPTNIGGKRLETAKRGDLDLQLSERRGGCGLIEDLFLGGLHLILRSLFEILDVVVIEQGTRQSKSRGRNAALQ